MRTYHELFRTPEFGPLFASSTLHVAGVTVSGLALSTLVFSATGSPLLSALAMFGPSLAQVLGATTLLSAADRLPPRATLAGLGLVSGLCTLVQALPGAPVWTIFALMLVIGTLSALGGGVRYGLLNELLNRDGYLLGRSVLNMSAGVTQICGFALGGALVAAVSPRGGLLTGAALYLAGALVTRLGLRARAPRADGRPSVAETWRNNRLLWSARPRRFVYLALWVPNGLVVGCESLFVPYSPGHAGLLLAVAAGGMFCGDVLAGRLLPRRWRVRLGPALRLLLGVPYLLFALDPRMPLALLAVGLASVGFSASLLLQERLMELTPDELSGHALGLSTSGMLTLQGVSAGLAGAVAEFTTPAVAMAVMGAASVTVTLLLAPGLRVPHDPSAAPEARGS
ncbi:MFS transporter [Streptomyces sp. AJS327]|uniref:MFS transporter n=1 Tax=Streptomyces sp. AJS327 TaxID=2545265 RepID=UPI0015DE3166|nr:MFS transporter [Streptomyces sp. AJS327]MBA0053971.1 MFS transporter [Streptomyces sp. AJS327]